MAGWLLVTEITTGVGNKPVTKITTGVGNRYRSGSSDCIGPSTRQQNLVNYGLMQTCSFQVYFK